MTTGGAATSVAQRRRNPRPKIAPYVFLLAPLAYLAVFMFWPLAREIWISLTNTRITNPNFGRYVGLGNYRRLLQDPDFYGTLWVTAIYTIGSVLFGVGLGVISALAINRPFPGRPVVRAILLFGWAVPNVATALIWLWIYNGQSGVLNRITSALGLGSMAWVASPRTALPAVLIVSVWQVTPFVMLVVLAALQSVPEETREAARIDGADALNVYRAVTLPHIMPAVQLTMLLVAVWSIRRFDIIYLLTGGGPLGSTSTLVLKIREAAFENFQLGMASAYGVVGLVLALLVSAVHLGVTRRRGGAA
jgi:multiple sugar transport system permease protein